MLFFLWKRSLISYLNFLMFLWLILRLIKPWVTGSWCSIFLPSYSWVILLHLYHNHCYQISLISNLVFLCWIPKKSPLTAQLLNLHLIFLLLTDRILQWHNQFHIDHLIFQIDSTHSVFHFYVFLFFDIFFAFAWIIILCLLSTDVSNIWLFLSANLDMSTPDMVLKSSLKCSLN